MSEFDASKLFNEVISQINNAGHEIYNLQARLRATEEAGEKSERALSLIKKWYMPVCRGSEYLETERSVNEAIETWQALQENRRNDGI